MSKTKMVSGKQLKPGDMVSGWNYEGHWRLCNAKVLHVNNFVVDVVIWPGPYGTEETVDVHAQFEIPLTEEEYRTKYAVGAKAVVEGLKIHLQPDEIGYHEMDNHWLGCSAFEMAEALEEMDGHVAGICPEIVPKQTMFSGSTLDVGVCVEMSDGDRFWCHWFMESVEDVIRNFQRRGET